MEKLVYVGMNGNFRGATVKHEATFFVKQDKVLMSKSDIEENLELIDMDNMYSSRDFFEVSIASIKDEIPCHIKTELDNIKYLEEKEADQLITVSLNKELTEKQIELVKETVNSLFPSVETKIINGVNYAINHIISYEQNNTTDTYMVKDKEYIERYYEYKKNVA